MNERTARRFCETLVVFEQMLSDRKYAYALPLGFEEIRLKMLPIELGNSVTMQEFLRSLEFEATIPPGEHKAKVYFMCGKISKSGATVTRIKEDIESLKPELQKVIIVTMEASNLTTPTIKDLRAIPDIEVEIFDPDFLALAIPKHILQPKFRVLSNAEKEQLLETYMAREDQLPGLAWDDPVRRWYGLAPGEVLSILRPSEGGETPYYRIVKADDPASKKKK